MDNRQFFYPSLLFSIVMLKESFSFEIFSRSLLAKINKKYTFASVWSDFENKNNLFRIFIQPSDFNMHGIWACYPSAQPDGEPQT